MQAAVPYLNRALAKESLGVLAAVSGDKVLANNFYQDALQVREFTLNNIKHQPPWHSSKWLST